MLRDPDEGPFLVSILNISGGRPRRSRRLARLVTFLGSILNVSTGRAVDDTVWLRSAEFLDKKQDPRGEFLRLDHRLSSQSPPDEITSAQRTRYRGLLHLVSPLPTWLKIVTRNERILNCGEASAQQLVVRFQYACPNQWETLSPTAEAGVRYCADCQRKVYFCDSLESVEQRALAGDCITVPQCVAAPVLNELAGIFASTHTGMPDVYQLWSERIFGWPENLDSRAVVEP
jgi:hypothetical protein